MLNFNKSKTRKELIKENLENKTTIELLEFLLLNVKTFDIDYCEDKNCKMTQLCLEQMILEVLTKRNQEQMFCVLSDLPKIEG